jgi:hypothetical protein
MTSSSTGEQLSPQLRSRNGGGHFSVYIRAAQRELDFSCRCQVAASCIVKSAAAGPPSVQVVRSGHVNPISCHLTTFWCSGLRWSPGALQNQLVCGGKFHIQSEIEAYKHEPEHALPRAWATITSSNRAQPRAVFAGLYVGLSHTAHWPPSLGRETRLCWKRPDSPV